MTTALFIILSMLFLAVLLTLGFFPRLQKPLIIPKRHRFETADELSPVEVPQKSFHIKHFNTPPNQYQLPDTYNEDRLALLVRDPEWLFAYWDLSAATLENFREKHGEQIFNESISTLRVYDITENGNAPRYFDIELNDQVKRCHIHVNKPNGKFYVALGRKKNNGEFLPLLFSNVVTTPRASVSSILDPDWLPYFEYAHLLYKDGTKYSSFNLGVKERTE